VREIPLHDIQAAARGVYDLVVRTPLIRLELPDARGLSPATEIFLKLETLQPIGHSKFVARTTSSGSSATTNDVTACGPSAPATPGRASRSPRGMRGSRAR
jgi:hypothetical protein